jgi:hypothetical protein
MAIGRPSQAPNQGLFLQPDWYSFKLVIGMILNWR